MMADFLMYYIFGGKITDMHIDNMKTLCNQTSLFALISNIKYYIGIKELNKSFSSNIFSYSDNIIQFQ